MNIYTSNKNSLKVTIVPLYQNNLSMPNKHNYVWEYNVYVENNGENPIKLINRNWQLIDSKGNIQDINDDSIIEQQPTILPGEAFGYTSHANLKTPSGIIKGFYKIISGEEEFEIEVPTFSLDNPNEEIKIN